MRVTISQDGGIAYFPGLSEPTVIESSDLTKKDMDALTALADKAGFFDQPEAGAVSTASRSRGADQRTVTLTIDDGKRKRTIRVAEPIADDKLRALVEFAQTKANNKRRKAK